MPILKESVCCKEIDQVVERMDEENELNCITEHTDFDPVCLNRGVLNTAFMQYRQQYGAVRPDVTENQ